MKPRAFNILARLYRSILARFSKVQPPLPHSFSRLSTVLMNFISSGFMLRALAS